VAREQDGDQRQQVDDVARRRARQRAAEMILSTPDLTDELTDVAARLLIEWGVAQAEAAVATGGTDLAAERAGPVRRVIKVISSLAADRRTLEPEQVAEELTLVLDLADRLPRPPVLQAHSVRSSGVADLAAWQTEMDDRTFVRSVLALLQGPQDGPGSGRGVQLAQ